MWQGLKEAFEAGGWPMYVNLCVSMVVLGIAIERAFVLFMRDRKLNKGSFMSQVISLITSGNYHRAITYCDVVSTPLSRVVKAGMIAAPKSDDETQAAMDEATLREVPVLEHRTGYLAMLGNVATLIGLFGTILGLIHSFSAVSMADPAEKASLLARSIAEAMNNTALGLGIAIPALVAFSIFQSRTQKHIDDLNEVAVTVLNLVTNNRAKGVSITDQEQPQQ